MPTTPPRARLGLLHEIPPDLRQLLKEAGFEWAGWSASWRNAVSGTEIPFAEVREHLDETWLRQRIVDALAGAKSS